MIVKLRRALLPNFQNIINHQRKRVNLLIPMFQHPQGGVGQWLEQKSVIRPVQMKLNV